MAICCYELVAVYGYFGYFETSNLYQYTQTNLSDLTTNAFTLSRDSDIIISTLRTGGNTEWFVVGFLRFY